MGFLPAALPPTMARWFHLLWEATFSPGVPMADGGRGAAARGYCLGSTDPQTPKSQMLLEGVSELNPAAAGEA